MRPSRSHESLSIALKNASTLTTVPDIGNRSNQSNSDYDERLLNGRLNQSASYQSSLSSSDNQQAYEHQQQQLQQQKIDYLIKLNLSESNENSKGLLSKHAPQYSAHSLPPAAPSSISLGGAGKEHLPVIVHSIHNSLLNEENCFEIRCLNSMITIISNSPTSTQQQQQPQPQLQVGFGIAQADNSGHDSGDREGDEEDSGQRDDENDRSKSETTATIEEEASVSKARKNISGPHVKKPPARMIRSPQSLQFTSSNSIKYLNTSQHYCPRYFMCRTSDERDKWLQCLKNVIHPNVVSERHEENSLNMWLLEAKGQPISSKANKKYFCDILINGALYARTCCKDKKEILFWGESFDFNGIASGCESVRVELYQETVETQKKKSKKEKEKDKDRQQDSLSMNTVNSISSVFSGSGSSSTTGSIGLSSFHASNQIMLGLYIFLASFNLV
jgi:hypothetical protein